MANAPSVPPATAPARIWSPEDALKNEFGTWYLNDELTSDWTDHLDTAARSSASSLRAVVGASQVSPLAALLRALRNDRAHPLTRQIEEDTQMDWTASDINWATFRRLLFGIESSL